MTFSEQIRGHTFLPAILGPTPFVIDAGSHKGEFATEIAQRYRAHVLALEPNRLLWSEHKKNSHIEFRAVALSHLTGMQDFHLSDSTECSSLLDSGPGQSQTITVPTIALSDLLIEHNREIDLLKLDIEGAECEVLLSATDNTLSRFRQITVEFHDFMYPELNEKVNQCIQRLSDLGFASITMQRKTREDVLFIRQDVAKKLSFQIRTIRYFDKNIRGIGRMLSRISLVNVRPSNNANPK